MPDFAFEDKARDQGYHRISGIDEAGRGPWAGPVIAGAVIIERAKLSDELLTGLDDSKKISGKKRERLYPLIMDQMRTAVGLSTVEEIDELNILQATMLAMKRAFENLGNPKPDFALIDGNRMPELDCDGLAVVKGDGLSLSIAAASIIAKVTRDQIMTELDKTHPGYGWANNAGYGTRQHSEAIHRLGISNHHRKSFAPIRKILRPDLT